VFYGCNFITFFYDDNIANSGEEKHVNVVPTKEDHRSGIEKTINFNTHACKA
jgi:hypothetical protein